MEGAHGALPLGLGIEGRVDFEDFGLFRSSHLSFGGWRFKCGVLTRIGFTLLHLWCHLCSIIHFGYLDLGLALGALGLGYLKLDLG